MSNIFNRALTHNYKGQLKNRIDRSIELLADEQFEAAAENDRETIRFLEKAFASNKGKAKNVLPLNLLVSYTLTPRDVVVYQRDTEVCNPSTDVFTQDLLSDGVTTKLLAGKQLQDFVFNVLALNIRLSRMDTYRTMYDKFIRHYDDVAKASYIRRLFEFFCGEISYEEEVVPLLKRFLETVAGMQKGEARTLFIRDITEIADQVFYPLDGLDGIIEQELQARTGECDASLTALAKSALKRDHCVEAFAQWIDSLEGNEAAAKSTDLAFVKQVMKEIETGQLQPKVKKPLDKNSWPYVISVLRDNNYTSAEKLEVCSQAVDYFRGKAIEKGKTGAKLRKLSACYWAKHKVRVQSYWKSFNEAMSKVGEVKNSDTLYFFIGDDTVNGSFALPLLMEAKKRGCYVIASNPEFIDFAGIEDEQLRKVAGSKYFSDYTDFVDSKRLRYDWVIDLPNKVISIEGLNLYEPIYQFIARWQFSCFYNYETNAWARARTWHFVNEIEKIYYQCELLYQWASENNKTVRIVSTSAHVPRFAAYLEFCEKFGREIGMEYIYVRSGYDDYFRNSSAKTATLCAMNMSRNPETRMPIFGTKEGFEEFYRDNVDNMDALRAKAEEWFTFQRSKNFETGDPVDDKKRNEIIDRVKAHRAAGKKVYLAIGKLIFDLAVRDTKGTAHDDMSDWITHVVETAAKNPDMLVLIKPHPHETRMDITMTDESIVTFTDIIKTEIPENVICLEGHLFRNMDLVPYVDVGLTWNSTSSLELAAMGIKTVMADTWGFRDYPIGFLRLDSREEYEDFLNDPDKYETDPQLKDRAIAFLSYMGSDRINMKNPYTETTSTNYHKFDSRINLDAVEDYVKNGDPGLEKIFDDTF